MIKIKILSCFIKKGHKNPIGFSGSPVPAIDKNTVTRDDLQRSGVLSNEFLGRINGGIIEVEPMDEIKADALLSDSRYSPISRLEELYHIKISLSDAKKHELIGMTAKYGVRGIYSELQSRINDAIFEDCTVKAITI